MSLDPVYAHLEDAARFRRKAKDHLNDTDIVAAAYVAQALEALEAAVRELHADVRDAS